MGVHEIKQLDAYGTDGELSRYVTGMPRTILRKSKWDSPWIPVVPIGLVGLAWVGDWALVLVGPGSGVWESLAYMWFLFVLPLLGFAAGWTSRGHGFRIRLNLP
jgi:hypothetical protein